MKKLAILVSFLFSFFFVACIPFGNSDEDEDLTGQVEFYINPSNSVKVGEKLCVTLVGKIKSSKYDKFSIFIELKRIDGSYSDYENATFISDKFKKRYNNEVVYRNTFENDFTLDVPCELLINDIGNYCIYAQIDVSNSKKDYIFGEYFKDFKITVTE